MPSLTAQATTFRTNRHQFRAFLSYLPQTVVLRALVNGTPSTWPTKIVTLDNITVGSVAAVRENQTVRVLDGSGNLRGICRVANGAGSGAVLQISEVSQGYVNITDNDTIEVIDEYRVFEKLVEASAALRKDSRITYTDQGSNPPPVANCGGLWAGFLDSGASYATVTFDASVSYVIDPDSGGTLTYLWSVGDGTITVGSTTTAAITVRFPVGWRHVTLTVTDSGNSKSTVRYVPVWVHSPDPASADYPKSVLMDSRNYTEGGWTPQFQLPVGSEADIDNLPDGALIVTWEDNRYGATQANYGSNVSGRSHIKFVGYLDLDQISIDAEDDTVVFTAISPLGVLAKTGVLPQLTVQKAAPTKWDQLKSNSVYRTLWYLWYWHNSAFTYFDFVRPASGDLGFTRFATTVTSNQFDQFKDIAGSMGLIVTCDWLGRLILDREPAYEDMTQRSNRTTAYDFTAADAVRLEWENNHHRETKVVKGEGITDGTTASANKAVYALYPGHAPALLASGVVTLDRQIVNNQAEMNERTVLHGAKVDSLYYGRSVPRGLRLTARGGYDVIDPALQEWVTITLPASTNRRGIAFTDATRWLVRAADVTYDSELGTKEVVYTLDHETFLDYDTFNASDITDIRPTPEGSNLPNINPPGLDFPGLYLPPIVIGDPITDGTPSVLLRILENGTALTTNLHTPEAAGGPTWAFTAQATLGITGQITDAAVNPYSTQYLGTGTIIQIAVATFDEIGILEWDRSDNSLTYANVHTFAVSLTGAPANILRRRNIEYTRGVANLLVCISDYMNRTGRTGVWSIVSTDGGTTWGTEIQISAFNHTATLNNPGLYVGRTGTIYTSANATTGTIGTFTGRRSTNSGASYTTLTSPLVSGSALAGTIHFPWHDNASELICYYADMNEQAVGGHNRIWRANGASRVNITPNDGSLDYGIKNSRCIHTPDNNRLRVGAAVCSSFIINQPPQFWAVFLSADAGNTWVKVGDTLTTNQIYSGIHISEGGVVYVWGAGALYIGMWNDLLAGGALDSREGNLSALSTARTVNIIGG